VGDIEVPSANGAKSDRDGRGRFVKGWKGGPGNPHASIVMEWRKALVKAVTPEDVTAVMEKLIEKARAGEAWAVKEFLDRCVGRPKEDVPDAVPVQLQINVELGYLMAERMVALSGHPPAPGLQALPAYQGEPDGETGEEEGES